MLSGVLAVVLQLLTAIAVAGFFAFGFAFLIFLGDANARGRPLVAGWFDRLAMLAVYLCWFALLWWFGFSRPLLMVACAAAVVLCLIYAASYHAALARRSRPG